MIKNSLRVLPFLLIFLIESGFLNFEQQAQGQKSPEKPPYLRGNSQWADSVFRSLSLEQRIGQLFIMPAYSRLSRAHRDNVAKLIREQKIGGVIFMQGGPLRQAKMTNYFQSVATTPLLIAVDGEWGLSMRLDSTMSFPRQMLLGAIGDESLIYDMGAEIARQCRRLGVHVNFAPVVDVNNNPHNPVINSRSFGEVPQSVSRKALAYMLGMQDNGIIATAKHFPGHGDTDRDSHKDLPVIPHSREHLDTVELAPFRYLIERGLGAVMTAHLHVPALEPRTNRASSLSKKVVTTLLRDDLGFQGLAITDAIGMQGVANYFDPGESDLEAILAGNDMVLMSKNVPKAIENIKKAIKQGRISEKEINKRCMKVLRAKAWVGLDRYKPIDLDSLYDDLHTRQADLIKRRLVEASLTLLKNEKQIIPFRKIDSTRIASVAIGDGSFTQFQQSLDLYDDVKHFSISKSAPGSEFSRIADRAARYDVVIVSIHNTSWYPSSYGITAQSRQFVKRLAAKTRVVLTLFANAYSLKRFDLSQTAGVLVAYDDSELPNNLAAQLLYGGIQASGRLPVGGGKDFPAGTGIMQGEKIRLKYSVPLELKIDEEKLKTIDSLALYGIKEGAYPGCEILLAKNGVVFYQKSFGHHTYAKKKLVQNTDIYDLASITKIGATLPAIIRLADQKKMDINAKLSKYIPELDSTDKKDMVVKALLSHFTRMASWMPFHEMSMKKNAKGVLVPDTAVFSWRKTKRFSRRVAKGFYIRPEYEERIYEIIYRTRMRSRRRYKYSDLAFYLLRRAVENVTQTRIDEYAKHYFYDPLGATTLTFNPLNRFPLSDVVPTEQDDLFRRQLVHGYVHDPGAAMLGGVSGHAGLFANANDLAKLMQMYLQKGEYGGERYFSEKTFDVFNRTHYKRYRNRRGLGFDKPRLNSRLKPRKKWLPPESFGHTGFTGTMVWIDPTNELLYIFLSNRVCPSAENRKLIELGIRGQIHKAIYESIGKI